MTAAPNPAPNEDQNDSMNYKSLPNATHCCAQTW
jgi:hypothetical protein